MGKKIKTTTPAWTASAIALDGLDAASSRHVSPLPGIRGGLGLNNSLKFS
jgi:hypothetical protein